MPFKSRSSKVKETSTDTEALVEGKETKTPDVAPEEKTDTNTVPSWRAEVVEEGAEEEKAAKEEKPAFEKSTGEEETPKEESSFAPAGSEAMEDKKVAEDETDKTTDLSGSTPEETTETPQTSESSWTEESSTTPTSDNTVTISLSKKLFWLFIFLIVAGLVIGGFFYYKSKVAGGSPFGGTAKAPTSTPALQPTATPTPSEEVKLDSYKVNIMNGAGIPGEAGKVQALLEKSGFKDFNTGNADNYNYTVTEVTLKKGVPEAVFNAIKEALGEYNVVNQEETLSEDSDFDVEIIIGTKQAAATPTPSD